MGIAKTFLAIGIAVVFAVFISYGLYVLYEPPYLHTACTYCYNFTEHCQSLSDPEFTTCENEVKQTPEYKDCQARYDQCIVAFNEQGGIYDRNSFYILAIIGIASIVVGMFLISLEGIGSGLIGGGILIILWSLIYTWEYWLEWNKYVKIVILGIVLVILTYFGYRKLEKKPTAPRKK